VLIVSGDAVRCRVDWSPVSRIPPSRPNVLIIVQNLSVPLDRRVWMECRGLREAGYGVSVICPRMTGDTAYQELDGVRIYRYRPPPAARRLLSYAVEFGYCWLATALLSARVAARDGITAIQTCNPPDTYWALASIYKFFGNRVFVFDQHDLCPEVYESRFPDGSRWLRRALRLLEGLNYRVADHVVVTNNSYRAIALGRGARRPDQVTVVRSGPLTSVMRPGPADLALAPLGPHLCCYLGVMSPQDGVDLLLASWRVLVHDLGRTDAHLALLGFGDCFEDLQRQATELGIAEYVTFTGRVGPDQIERYLRTAVIGLSPDPLNPLNDVSTMNKTMEYMAYGLPVIAYDLKETRVSADAAGIFVTPGDIEGYARAISDLLDDSERRRALGSAARLRAQEVLDWKEQERKYVGVFDGLLGVHRQSRRTENEGIPGELLDAEV
jgi:glycosyltransferase involved in cell wall biosynthesis